MTATVKSPTYRLRNLLSVEHADHLSSIREATELCIPKRDQVVGGGILLQTKFKRFDVRLENLNFICTKDV